MKIKKYISALLLVSLLPISQVVAQTNDQNLNKYWFYRYRLQNDFMQIGPAQGQSIPAEMRELFVGDVNRVKWADATIYLGWYLGVLATEYHLLNAFNEDTENITQELFWALSALERLDFVAEMANFDNVTPPQAGELNGFFIRDDIPFDFLDDPEVFDHFNQGLTNQLFVEAVESDFCAGNPACDPTDDPVDALRLKEMSQDQVIHLFLGLALVEEFVPIAIEVDGISLNVFARTQVDRLIGHVGTTKWLIVNPVTGQIVRRGHNAQAYSYALAKAAKEITGIVYQNPLSTLAYPVWNLQQTFVNPNKDNNHMSASLAAVGDSWRAPFPLSSINTTEGGIETVTLKTTGLLNQQWDWRGFYLLYYSVYHSINAPIHPDVLIDLNSAPCEGPFSLVGGNLLGTGWEGRHKYTQNEAVSLGFFFNGEYNGLDYMLLHNLHYIEDLVNLPFYQNKMESVQTRNYPVLSLTPPSVGSKFNPFQVEAFRSIVASNTINSNGDITYRAGEKITLLPGFRARIASDFHAFIQPFTCVNGNYQKTGPNSTALGPQMAYGMGPSIPLQNTFTEAEVDYSDNAPSFMEEVPLEQNAQLITIFPNPNSGAFTITMTQKNEAQISIVNMLGDLVLESNELSAIHQIDISNQPKGIYFVKVVSEDIVYTEKIILQ